MYLDKQSLFLEACIIVCSNSVFFRRRQHDKGYHSMLNGTRQLSSTYLPYNDNTAEQAYS